MPDSKQERWTPHNPLGVIALFVFLIETVATVSLRAINDHSLTSVLVWFIVLFPIAIAATFFVVLWFRREALYAPMDLPKGEFTQLLLKVDEARKLSTIQLYYSLGESRRLQGKWKEAREAFQAAIKMNPQHTSALLGLAETKVGQANKINDPAKKKALLDEALEASTQAIKIDPKFAPAYMVRAIVRIALDPESAQVRKDLEHADHLDQGLKDDIAEEEAFHPLRKYDWFESRFRSIQEKGA